MRIYNRTNRQHVRYYLRMLRAELTPIDYWTLIMALTFLLFLAFWPASAAAQHGTIPPVSGIACIPAGAQPDISGCDDKVFLPIIEVQP